MNRLTSLPAPLPVVDSVADSAAVRPRSEAFLTRPPDAEKASSPAVSVILPTYNEAENIQAVITAIQAALREVPHHEILVVDDDSPDGTWQIASDLGHHDRRIRCHRRLQERGLASAIFDGLARAQGEVLVVIDADLQHDPEVIPSLVAALKRADVAVASRYTSGGGTSSWSAVRCWMSRLATSLGQWALGSRITDPMSGFFALRRRVFRDVREQLRPRGFKALLEILSKARNAEVTEVPYTFRPRQAGTSKLGAEVVVDYLLSLIELRSRSLISAQFLSYCLVGLSGVFVQLGSLAALQFVFSRFFSGSLSGSSLDSLALAMAILIAMVSNFALNNAWTFRHNKLSRSALGIGLLRFIAVSSVGAVLNHACSMAIHRGTGIELVWTSLVGIAAATLWNYALNRLLIWREPAQIRAEPEAH